MNLCEDCKLNLCNDCRANDCDCRRSKHVLVLALTIRLETLTALQKTGAEADGSGLVVDAGDDGAMVDFNLLINGRTYYVTVSNVSHAKKGASNEQDDS